MSLKGFDSIFKVPDLKRKILFTLGVLAVYRLGAAIPTPGIDPVALKDFFEQHKSSLFGFLDIFSGGALNRLSIFSMGIMPYINSSIIMSLLQTTIPYLEKLSKEGEAGRKKINQITRYSTLVLGAIQSYGLTFMMLQMKSGGGAAVVKNPGLAFQLLTVLTLTTGTVFIMWLGERITEDGIGNGISLIIFAGIVDRIPAAIKYVFMQIQMENLSIITAMLLVAVIFAITALVVLVESGHRKIPVQYAKRMVGRKMYGGQTTYLPIRVDQSGVIAVIFAISLMTFPMTFAQFMPNAAILQRFTEWINRGSWLYNVIYVGLIIFFCYMYNAISFNPNDLAENIKKWGGFIQGLRPGPPTAQYIESILMKITLGGALFVSFIAVFPDFLTKYFNAPFYFGGTSLLIAVGVGLDTVSQIEAQLIMRHYEGFVNKGKIKGRYFNV